MIKSGSKRFILSKELLFQLILHGLVFLFYSFNQRNPKNDPHELAFFANYALAGLFVSYYLLPRYLYPKKYYHFFIGLALVVATVLVVEEFILERIYFPDTRGKYYQGLLLTLIDVTPVMTILVGFKFGWDALRKQREVDQLKVAAEENELQFLKSQINPHFLFNNLNNLYAYAIEQSPKTPTIILELSAVLRYMLYECRERYVPLSKELEQLKNFTQLNELQIEERGEVTFEAPTDTGPFQIAPLILMVFIENAFKHSQASQSSGIRIKIKAELDASGNLDFYCSNSFLPTSNTEKINAGIGLENVRKRLQLIYPNAHTLDIAQEDGLFSVHLRIQLQKGRDL